MVVVGTLLRRNFPPVLRIFFPAPPAKEGNLVVVVVRLDLDCHRLGNRFRLVHRRLVVCLRLVVRRRRRLVVCLRRRRDVVS